MEILGVCPPILDTSTSPLSSMAFAPFAVINGLNYLEEIKLQPVVFWVLCSCCPLFDGKKKEKRKPCQILRGQVKMVGCVSRASKAWRRNGGGGMHLPSGPSSKVCFNYFSAASLLTPCTGQNRAQPSIEDRLLKHYTNWSPTGWKVAGYVCFPNCLPSSLGGTSPWEKWVPQTQTLIGDVSKTEE